MIVGGTFESAASITDATKKMLQVHFFWKYHHSLGLKTLGKLKIPKKGRQSYTADMAREEEESWSYTPSFT